MAKSAGSNNTEESPDASSAPSEANVGITNTSESGQPEQVEGHAEKQRMVEKLFRHTNQFLEDNKHDPLLVVEALAAILVRYVALFGPVEQMKDRLSVLERLIVQESSQIQEIAKSANWSAKP